MKLQKENKFKKMIANIAFVTALVSGSFFGTNLIKNIINYGNERATSQQQIELVTEATNPNYEDPYNIEVYEDIEPEEFESKYDFDKLHETNPNIVGVIEGDCFEGGYYPVVGTTSFDEENYYLYHSVDGSESTAGSIIADYRSDNTMQSDVTAIWGHNMHGQEGVMFGSLTNYSNQEYYNNHPTLRYYTPNGEYVLEIFAYVEDDPSQHLIGNYNSDEEFVTEMNNIINSSMIDTGINISEDDRVIRLICCTERGSQRDGEIRAEVYARLAPVREITPNTAKTK